MMCYPRVIADHFDATVRFYTDLLGLSPERFVSELQYASFDLGSGTVLAILGRSSAEAVVPIGNGHGGVVLVLPVPDVDKVVANLPSDAITAYPEDRDGWGVRSAYLRDPEGNLVEVQTY